MVAVSHKLNQVEPKRAKLASENTKLQRSITRLERERNQARVAAENLKTKLEGTEDSLNQALAELETSKADLMIAHQRGYNEGIHIATESYKAQMRMLQDEIWAAAWVACLTKAGIAETSPLWIENDLLSIVAIPEEELAEEEEDSLDGQLNVKVFEQMADHAGQEDEDFTNLG